MNGPSFCTVKEYVYCNGLFPTAVYIHMNDTLEVAGSKYRTGGVSVM